jgi:hypothetical protein
MTADCGKTAEFLALSQALAYTRKEPDSDITLSLALGFDAFPLG